MPAMNDRVHLAMIRLGQSRVDIAELFGMDTSIPLAMQPPEKVPRPTIGNVAKISGHMGVSVRWILYGEPENDVDRFVIGQQACAPSCGPSCGLACNVDAGRSASQGGAVISGAQNSTVVVQHITGDDLSSMEREMIHAIRSLSARDQAAVMAYVFALEKESAEKKSPQHKPGAFNNDVNIFAGLE